MQDIRLPQNKRENFLYGGLIAFVTVIVMLILNIGTSFGNLYGETLLLILEMLPVMWAICVLLEPFVIGPLAEKLVKKCTKRTDSFYAVILFRILFCVTGMLMCMTILGGMLGQLWIGQGFNLEPFTSFLSHWPRNFCVAFWCEIIFAQPIARACMKTVHRRKNVSANFSEDP